MIRALGPWSGLAVVGLLLLSTACGFHLRTWDLEGSVESAYVASSPRHDLAEPMRRALNGKQNPCNNYSANVFKIVKRPTILLT